jgi:hypothetical protein
MFTLISITRKNVLNECSRLCDDNTARVDMWLMGMMISRDSSLVCVISSVLSKLGSRTGVVVGFLVGFGVVGRYFAA